MSLYLVVCRETVCMSPKLVSLFMSTHTHTLRQYYSHFQFQNTLIHFSYPCFVTPDFSILCAIRFLHTIA